MAHGRIVASRQLDLGFLLAPLRCDTCPTSRSYTQVVLANKGLDNSMRALARGHHLTIEVAQDLLGGRQTAAETPSQALSVLFAFGQIFSNPDMKFYRYIISARWFSFE